MDVDKTEAAASATFEFSWRGLTFSISGDADLVREGFELLRLDVLPQVQGGGEVEDFEPEPAAGQSAPPATPTEAEKLESGAQSPREYFDAKQPKSEQEKAVVLATYAKLYRNAQEFTVADLEGLHNEAHVPIKNVQNAIYNAGRKDYGWIKRVSGKRNVYQITAAGESFVKTQLPKK
jgi:hypothetical protein